MVKTIIAVTVGILLAFAIIGGVLFFVYTQNKHEAENRAKVGATKAMLSVVRDALDLYYGNIGHFPTLKEGGLKALLQKPTFDNAEIADDWGGPYFKKEPKDAWGNSFSYEPPQSLISLSYRLWSNGPDGTSGTADDIQPE
jgi:general secretion pathway protein G